MVSDSGNRSRLWYSPKNNSRGFIILRKVWEGTLGYLEERRGKESAERGGRGMEDTRTYTQIVDERRKQRGSQIHETQRETEQVVVRET